MALICFHCAKPVRGKAVHLNPRSYPGAYRKTFHAKCYVKAEALAAAELGLPLNKEYWHVES